MSKKTVVLDKDTVTGRYQAGMSVTFDSRLPTVDDGLGFMISQLAYLESKWYEAKYPEVNFGELVDVNTETPEWADSVDFRMYDGVTMGKFIGANADDLPRVAASAKLFSAKIGYGGNEFEYSLDELRKSAHLNLPLDNTLAKMARRGAEEHTQRVVYFGDAERGMTGLFNNPNVPVDNSLLDWFDPATTPLDIFEDLNDILSEVYTNTKGVHTANTLVLPANRWTYIVRTPMSETIPDVTILDYLKKNNVYTARTGLPLNVFTRFQLTQEELAKNINGYSDGDIVLAYDKSPENLETHIPMFWRPTAPQPRGLKIVIPAEYKASGVQWRYPMSGVYRKMIKR